MRNKLIIILASILFLLEFYLITEYLGGSSITGQSILIENNNELIFDDTNSFFFEDNLTNYFEFSARFSEDIINHDSWHIGGFGNSTMFDENDKAVFYVDVGVITPYLQIDKNIYWCKSFIKDWTEYHLFKIIIENKTTFYIDNENICEFDQVPGLKLSNFINENDKVGDLIMYAMGVKNIPS